MHDSALKSRHRINLDAGFEVSGSLSHHMGYRAYRFYPLFLKTVYVNQNRHFGEVLTLYNPAHEMIQGMERLAVMPDKEMRLPDSNRKPGAVRTVFRD